MHHVAFELKDWAQILAACDFLGSKNIPLIWGPGRHGPGHNIYTYHRNPDDQIIETVHRARQDAGRGARLFRSAAVAPRPAAEAEGVELPSDIWGPPPTPEYIRQRE